MHAAKQGLDLVMEVQHLSGTARLRDPQDTFKGLCVMQL